MTKEQKRKLVNIRRNGFDMGFSFSSRDAAIAYKDGLEAGICFALADDETTSDDSRDDILGQRGEEAAAPDVDDIGEGLYGRTRRQLDL